MSTVISLLTSHWAIAGGVGTFLTAALPFIGNIATGGTLTYIKMGLYALAALVLIGGTFYVTREFYVGQIAQVQAQIATATAKANAKALADEQAYEAKANTYIAQAQADVTQAQQNEAALRKVLNAQPKTYACTRSPAFGALLNAMRASGGN